MQKFVLAAGDKHGRTFQGFIKVMNEEHYIVIRKKVPTTLAGASLFGGPNLQRLIAKQQDAVAQLLARHSEPRQFLSDLINHLQYQERLIVHENTDARDYNMVKHEYTNLPAQQYSLLLKQLEDIGLQHINVSKDLTSFMIYIQDVSGRQHTMNCQIPTQGNSIYPLKIDIDLPCQIPAQITKTDIPTAVANMQELINEHSLLFDEMENLDKHAFILDPASPRREHTHRRLALGHHCSLHIDITNLKNPRSEPPVMQLYGAESKIATWRDALNRNLSSWNSSKSILENIISTLEISELPQKDGMGDNAVANVDCGICYAYNLNASLDQSSKRTILSSNPVPDQICNNSSCGRAFHHQCLYEWLRSVPTTRQSFNILFGFCPYCSENITTKVIL